MKLAALIMLPFVALQVVLVIGVIVHRFRSPGFDGRSDWEVR